MRKLGGRSQLEKFGDAVRVDLASFQHGGVQKEPKNKRRLGQARAKKQKSYKIN